MPGGGQRCLAGVAVIAPIADVTQLLAAHSGGDREAFAELFQILYADLRRRAIRQLGAWGGCRKLNTTSLVNEAYLKLVDQKQLSSLDRGHFLAIAANAMSNIIVDYARARLASKRGSGRTNLSLDWEAHEIAVEDEAEQLVNLDQLLGKLSAIDERLTRVVECRFFAGLTEEETAAALDTPLRTVQRDWVRARAWLRTHLAD
jgi:RNA polymerase sigma factor (TIGR02999 family)